MGRGEISWWVPEFFCFDDLFKSHSVCCRAPDDFPSIYCLLSQGAPGQYPADLAAGVGCPDCSQLLQERRGPLRHGAGEVSGIQEEQKWDQSFDHQYVFTHSKFRAFWFSEMPRISGILLRVLVSGNPAHWSISIGSLKSSLIHRTIYIWIDEFRNPKSSFVLITLRRLLELRIHVGTFAFSEFW
jgi:hypothetical protein